MLKQNWVSIKWNPIEEQKKVLIALIDSTIGHKIQDEMFLELMESVIKECEDNYTKDIKAILMYCEIRHLGGRSAATRIFKKCNNDYSLDNIMAVLKKD